MLVGARANLIVAKHAAGRQEPSLQELAKGGIGATIELIDAIQETLQEMGVIEKDEPPKIPARAMEPHETEGFPPGYAAVLDGRFYSLYLNGVPMTGMHAHLREELVAKAMAHREDSRAKPEDDPHFQHCTDGMPPGFSTRQYASGWYTLFYLGKAQVDTATGETVGGWNRDHLVKIAVLRAERQAAGMRPA